MAKSFQDLVARTTSKKAQARGQALAKQYLREMVLADLRKHRGMSQKAMADALGIKQPSLSKIEKQGDMQISTLRKFVEALDGELVVKARLANGKSVDLGPFTASMRSKATPRSRAASHSHRATGRKHRVT